MKSHPAILKNARAFTLVETLIGTSVGSVIIGALLLASIALQRSFAASEDYATATLDQLRIMDYISMDCRRAVTVTAGTNSLTILNPSYYSVTGTPNNPAITSGAISYGGSTVTVTYSLQGNSIIRQEGTTSRVIAVNVSDFTVTTSDMVNMVKTTITFMPVFKTTNSTTSKSGTSLSSTVYLRNAAARS